MEESIKKAEELIEETSATLARMQHDTSCDDLSLGIFDGKELGDRKKGKKLGFGDIRHVLSSREKILETDEAFNVNKRHSIRDDKIDELNYKIEAYRLEMLERGSMRAFHFDRNESMPATRTTSDTNLSQRAATKMKLANVTEDLKSKLQQTQEIVDRGIQTARELNESVEVLRSSRQPQTGRYDELSLYKSEKSARSECGSSVKGKRCKRCNAEIIRKPDKGKDRKKEDNVLVTRVRGMDSSSPRRKNKLNFQQLPSLKIQGGLSCQRIPSIDIPPGKPEPLPQRANTAYETYSHEEITRDRIDKIIGNIKNSSGSVQSDNGKRTKSVECSNCGKVLRVSDKVIRTEQIDELLKICDYNVFDPRIDEFVGRFSGEMEEEAKYTQTEVEPPKPIEIAPEKESPKVEKKVRISDLSAELSRKYREKAMELETDHLEFEGILRELFEKMDESRTLLKNCDYLNTVAEVGKRKTSLTVTPPMLLSYTGSGEEADDGRNTVLRPRRPQKNKLPSKLIRKKLERKELEINCKLISSASPSKDKSKEMTPESTTPNLKPVSEVETSLITREKIPKKESVNRKLLKPTRDEAIKPKPPEISAPESKQSPPPEPVQVQLNGKEEPVKQTNMVSDYESDFEEESSEEKLSVPQTDDNSPRHNAKLSTICEVESELDREMSNLTITPEMENEKVQELEKTDEKVISPKRSSASSDEDDTRKLLKRVNRELKEVTSQQLVLTNKKETMNKSSEVEEPLKEVLNALKSQFERTELLADRLTESIKEVKEVKKTENGEEISLSTGRRDFMMVNNLQRARKNIENGKFFSTRPNSSRTIHGKSRKSFRESKSTQDDVHSLSPSGSISSKGSISTGKSYSEGEISEQEVLVSDRTSPSIGEVINENHSEGSFSEETSVIKFL